MQQPNLVLLTDILQVCSADRSTLRKHCLSRGIRLYKVRTPNKRGRPALAVRPEDAEAIKRYYLHSSRWQEAPANGKAQAQ